MGLDVTLQHSSLCKRFWIFRFNVPECGEGLEDLRETYCCAGKAMTAALDVEKSSGYSHVTIVDTHNGTQRTFSPFKPHRNTPWIPLDLPE